MTGVQTCALPISVECIRARVDYEGRVLGIRFSSEKGEKSRGDIDAGTMWRGFTYPLAKYMLAGW